MLISNISKDQAVAIGGGLPAVVFCGPCVIESRDHAFFHAEKIKEIATRLSMPLVYKSSYDKANRTSANSFRGLGLEEGLKILGEIREQLSLPVITDIHSVSDAKAAGEVVDVVQVPAFLCRQTDILLAAANTNKPVLVKKGQFVAPADTQFIAEKIRSVGNDRVMLCERGASFGYRELVVDFRGIKIMAQTGCPIVFDATHSVQSMGGASGVSGGNREDIPLLVRAAAAVGVDGLFIEAHQSPETAPSDGANMLPIEELEKVLSEFKELSELSSSMKSKAING